MYASRSEAEMMLPQIQKYDPEAYVKASGSRLGHFYSSPAGTTGSVGTGAAPGGWLGTWKAEDGRARPARGAGAGLRRYRSARASQ